MRIGNEADAKGVVRRYINGTRSRHGKIASIMMDEESIGPDEKGMWTIEGSYVRKMVTRSHSPPPLRPVVKYY